MNTSVKAVIDDLKSNGSTIAVDLFSKIFSESNNFFNKEFDNEKFIFDLWKRFAEIDDNNRRITEEDENQLIKESNVWSGDSTGSFNIIPTNGKKGVCSELCLTLINDRFRYRHIYGNPRNRRHYEMMRDRFTRDINGVILLLSSYWFSCMNINKENLILTPYWNQNEFEGITEDIIEAYTKNHKKQVYIIEIGKSGTFLRYPY